MKNSMHISLKIFLSHFRRSVGSLVEVESFTLKKKKRTFCIHFDGAQCRSWGSKCTQFVAFPSWRIQCLCMCLSRVESWQPYSNRKSDNNTIQSWKNVYASTAHFAQKKEKRTSEFFHHLGGISFILFQYTKYTPFSSLASIYAMYSRCRAILTETEWASEQTNVMNSKEWPRWAWHSWKWTWTFHIANLSKYTNKLLSLCRIFGNTL